MYDSRLLLDESPLVIQKTLARTIGLNESIVLQQIHYWLLDVVKKKKQDHFKEGYYWVWNTLEEWHSQFDWWSLSTVRRVLEGLESDGLIITGSFNRLALDKTKWYRIDYAKLRSVAGEERSFQHPEIQGSTRFVQNEQIGKSRVLANDAAQTQSNPSAQIEQMDCSFWTNASAQIGQSICSDWTKPSAQIEQSNNHRITTKTSNKEEECGADAPTHSPQGKSICGKGFEQRQDGEAEKPAKKERKKSKSRLKASDVYPLMSPEVREMFEKAWVWYCKKCKAAKASAGDKITAADAWLKTITPDNIDRFRYGCKLFFQDDRAYGIPHFYGFIAGNAEKPTPYWESAIIEFESAQENESDFLDGVETPITTSDRPIWQNESGEIREDVIREVMRRRSEKFKQPRDRVDAIDYINSNSKPGSMHYQTLAAICEGLDQPQTSDRTSDDRPSPPRIPPSLQKLFDDFTELSKQIEGKTPVFDGMANGTPMYQLDGKGRRFPVTEEHIRDEIQYLQDKQAKALRQAS